MCARACACALVLLRVACVPASARACVHQRGRGFGQELGRACPFATCAHACARAYTCVYEEEERHDFPWCCKRPCVCVCACTCGWQVKELNEAGEVVGETGPDPNAPRGSIWHKQTVEGAMGNDSEGAPDPNRCVVGV